MMRNMPAPRFATSEDFFTYCKDTFDVLYAEGATSPKMMSIGMHCRLSGRAGRTAGLARFIDYVRESREGLDLPADRHRSPLDR